MSSLRREFAQRLTRNFVVTQDAGNSEQGAYFYSDNDIDFWYAANSANIEKIGSLYLINGTTSGTTFIDVLEGNNGATEIQHSNNNIDERKTIKDMGKEVIIGTSGEPRLLVLRRVQQYSPYLCSNSVASSDYNGYVVVENNAENLQGNTGRFTVRVARI
jgi:hypothetical protein